MQYWPPTLSSSREENSEPIIIKDHWHLVSYDMLHILMCALWFSMRASLISNSQVSFPSVHQSLTHSNVQCTLPYNESHLGAPPHHMWRFHYLHSSVTFKPWAEMDVCRNPKTKCAQRVEISLVWVRTNWSITPAMVSGDRTSLAKIAFDGRNHSNIRRNRCF